MFSMTKKQARGWIVALSITSAILLAAAVLLLLWMNAGHNLVPAA